MALVVEDGTGKPNANSYAGLTAANDYCTLRGITSWGLLTTGDKEAALINATDYLEATYRSAWKGYRVGPTQALSWPRYDVIVDDFPVNEASVPSAVSNACIELAVRAASGTLLADQGPKVIREKVDVLEVEYAEYSDSATHYTLVGRMLSPYLLSGSSEGSASVMRVVRS